MTFNITDSEDAPVKAKWWLGFIAACVLCLVYNILVYKAITKPYVLEPVQQRNEERQIQRELPCTSKGMVYYKPYKSDAICLPKDSLLNVETNPTK